MENISINDMKMSENKTTINDLNNDCIQEIINKLSINEILRIEIVDKRFEYCVKEDLKRQKVIRFAENGLMFCRHSANNSKLVFINLNKFKLILKKCPNIKCL
jgi:predicted AAA+ superfamily ATPase